MKRFAFVVVAALFLLTACAAPQNQAADTSPEDSAPSPTIAAPIMVTDALGREVELAEPPTQIAITGKALIMVVDAVYMFPEAPGLVAAMSNAGQAGTNFISLIDADYAAKATLEHSAGAEQIAAAQPDLVILKSYLAETLGEPLAALNIPVIYLEFETPEQYERDMMVLGKVFQNETRAQEINAYYQDQAAEIQAALEGIDSKPRVLMLFYNDKDGAVAFNVPSTAWMQTRIVQLAGGEPAWSSANPSGGGGWTKVSLEQIAAWDADQIFIISYAKNSADIVAGLESDPQWQALRAVKEGHLSAFPGDIYSWDQADARWILGLTWLAGRLHPEQFPEVDIVHKAEVFYQTLYGLDNQFFEENIRPTFRGDLR
jgi:iron complex transport system substrate-binding protein